MTNPKVVVVIPTYNEVENIEKTLTISDDAFKKVQNFNVHILVVDATSPDGTANIVRHFIKNHPHVHLLVKSKGGLGADYVAGFKYAMDKLKADFVGEMDADLQHNPQDVIRFLKVINDGADVAVGSRFVVNGSIPSSWGVHRKFLSIIGNLYARLGTGMHSAHDITSGFRITRVKGFLDSVNLDELYSKRFSYKIDLYYRLYKLKAKIVEVPIIFKERAAGGSKIQVFSPLGTNDWLDSFRVTNLIFLERLNLLKYSRFFMVAIIGIIGGVVQFLLYYIFSRILFLSPAYANALSIEAAVLSNFILNYQFAFKDRKFGKIFPKIITFHLSSLGSILIQIIIFNLGFRYLQQGIYWEYFYQIVGIWVGLIWNYTAYTKVVWRKKI